MRSARSLATVLSVTALGSTRAQARELFFSDFESPAAVPPEFRSFDGTGNNLSNPLWGSAGTDYARMARVDYADGFSTARLTGRPNPRSVGDALMRQTGARPNNRNPPGSVYAFETSSPTTPTAPTQAPAS